MTDPATGWGLACDKLRLHWTVSERQLPDGLLSTEWGEPRRARNRGSYSITERKAFLVSPDSPATFLLWRSFAGMISQTLVVEFSPWAIQTGGLALLRANLESLGVHESVPLVERVDVAVDIPADPYRFRLDPGLMASDAFGVTPRGPETERCGYRVGQPTKVQKYNKGLKRRLDGEKGVPDYLRFEVSTRSPRLIDDPDGDRTGAIRFDELHRLAYPLPDRVGLVELVRDPDCYGDARYLALGCVALQMGPKAARRAAKEILGDTQGVAKFEGVFWEDHRDRLFRVFDRQWPAVCRGIWGQVFPALACAG